jgi:hypothetical protein
LKISLLYTPNTLDAPDTDFFGCPANLKTGYRISGRISGAGRIQDIRPDFKLKIQMFIKIPMKLTKTSDVLMVFFSRT